MTRLVQWIWRRGVVSTFLAGFFIVLPIAITIGIMSWAGSKLQEWLGPKSYFGQMLTSIGMRYATDQSVAMLVGWVIVLAGIWLLGAFVKTAGIRKVRETFDHMVNRIPIVSQFYGPVSQVVDLLKQDEQDKMEGMNVVFCSFGLEHGGGFLALMAAPNVYRFAGHDYHVIYIPTSPIPMSGGVIFVPVERVHKVDMKVDDLMQIYFSIGVMSAKVIPNKYVSGGGENSLG